jgi:hypothetical protein
MTRHHTLLTHTIALPSPAAAAQAAVAAAGGLPVLGQVLAQQADPGVQRAALALLEALVGAGGAALAAQVRGEERKGEGVHMTEQGWA